MKPITQLPNVSSQPTKAFEVTSPSDFTTQTSSKVKCKVFLFEQFNGERIPTPPQHTAISDLIATWDKDANRKVALEEARRWVNESFHSDEGDTVRTFRLRKGWSQARLSQELGTSQPHIARIERGTENITIETCRKLCQALEIDLTTLDRALQNQEKMARSK